MDVFRIRKNQHDGRVIIWWLYSLLLNFEHNVPNPREEAVVEEGPVAAAGWVVVERADSTRAGACGGCWREGCNPL